jgi:hypothetical protein
MNSSIKIAQTLFLLLCLLLRETMCGVASRIIHHLMILLLEIKETFMEVLPSKAQHCEETNSSYIKKTKEISLHLEVEVFKILVHTPLLTTSNRISSTIPHLQALVINLRPKANHYMLSIQVAMDRIKE